MSMPASQSTPSPTLADLLDGIAQAPPVPVTDITSDSRRLVAGAVFLACRGARAHALEFLAPEAAARAAAIVWDGDAGVSPPTTTPVVVVPDLRARLGDIANRWFDSPSAALAVTGVTGTNGKTTLAWLLAQCWQRLGQRCAYLGTLGGGIDEITDTGGLTTPDCIELHRALARFRDAGAVRAALEVSSHALDQARLAGVHFAAAAFTNLSRDHIDYHGDMTRYGESKARLFTEFTPLHRVICVDDEFGQALATRAGDDAIRVATTAVPGATTGRHVVAGDIEPTATGTRFRVRSSWGNGACELPLPGHFNVANACEVLALLLCDGVALDDALAVMATVTPPPGRMERVTAGAAQPGPQVFVDYSHTPAALAVALRALRPHCEGTLWCVFGCGGDRDRGKRPLMGAVVEAEADRAVLTSDNPRTEDAAAIMSDVATGMSVPPVAIEDRAAAICWTIRQAAPVDTVLIAGKGHENYQVLGERRIPFSDFQVAAQCLRELALAGR
ncbi:MAG: UDP-N-acetylmuramoyl-L-alanyl-D-glutamate--2,6-diaminopimelate ligase [Woeseiaceae bacterium]|nr:UDP-N-acetylmuramoyl-L-alanyl-D-glutamate--2,6-diaminopimelate ligase [Woeseiaceae bacterium]